MTEDGPDENASDTAHAAADPDEVQQWVRPKDLADEFPFYMNACAVDRIVDGDTLVLDIDLGYDVMLNEWLRLDGVDTAETWGVSHDSREYQEGLEQTQAVAAWVERGQQDVDGDYPFVLYSKEYEKGSYDRVIGDIWSDVHEEWLTVMLIEEFDVAYEY